MNDTKLKKKTSTAEKNEKENDFLIKESSHKIRRQGLLSVLRNVEEIGWTFFLQTLQSLFFDECPLLPPCCQENVGQANTNSTKRDAITVDCNSSPYPRVPDWLKKHQVFVQCPHYFLIFIMSVVFEFTASITFYIWSFCFFHTPHTKHIKLFYMGSIIQWWRLPYQSLRWRF